MPTSDIGIDLGTRNSLAYSTGKGLVLNEPSIVVYDKNTEKIRAIGEEARLMEGRITSDMEIIRPIRQGVIVDYTVTEKMLKYFISRAIGRRAFRKPRISICVPSGITEIERKAVEEATYQAGAREVFLVEEPIAAAIGAGIDIARPCGNMIVDIGGGTTEIAVISLGGIVSNNSIRVAGDDLTNDIQEYMGRQHNVKVGERTAELIKINVGSALTELDNPPEDYVVHGPNRMTALPMEVPISYQEIAHCIEKSISKIEAAVLNALEHTPPELYADIVRNGIWLAGGGALLRGLDKRLTDKIGIPFHIAEDPLHAVAKGTGVALKNIDQFSFLIR